MNSDDETRVREIITAMLAEADSGFSEAVLRVLRDLERRRGRTVRAER